MEIRKITENERSDVNRLHNYVYGAWVDGQVKKEDLTYIIPDETYGAFNKKDELISTFSVLALKQSIRGVLKGMGGIAMVGTYPEARYEGHIRKMMKPAFEDMKANGLAYSMMSPFRDSFYARFGYVTTNTHMIAKAPLNGLRYALDTQIDDDWTVERCRAASVKKDFLDFVWEIAPSRFHGFVIYPSISDEEWKRRNKDRLIVIIKKHGQVEAVSRYRTKGFGHGAMGPVGEILVDEMYWRTLDARSILFNFFAKHIDQVAYITMNLPFGTNIQQWVIDQMEFIEIKLWFPWCSRIIDVEPALASLPAEGDAELTFRLSDNHCEWNNGTYTLKAESGRLIINKNTAKPDVKLTIEGLSALVYGTLSLDEIVYKGWVKISDLSAKKTLKQWFPPILIYSAFGY